MIRAQTTTAQPVPPAANRPAERSSRLSNGLIPLAIVAVVIAAAQWRRYRRRAAAASAARAEPPADSPR
ncbi:MAG TPA: hypothetical protein VFN38_12365 [Gemmatimonadaceae bacterium]|nr:hypothetical protein [Gemmatimonadaceae bacterium]